MNRRRFLHSVGGVAVMGAMHPAGLELVDALPGATPPADTSVLIHAATYADVAPCTLASETGAGGLVTFAHTAAGATVSSSLRAGRRAAGSRGQQERERDCGLF